jgi:hypothetical protein
LQPSRRQAPRTPRAFRFASLREEKRFGLT